MRLKVNERLKPLSWEIAWNILPQKNNNNKNLQESFLKPIMEETEPGRFKTNFDVAIW